MEATNTYKGILILECEYPGDRYRGLSRFHLDLDAENTDELRRHFNSRQAAREWIRTEYRPFGERPTDEPVGLIEFLR